MEILRRVKKGDKYVEVKEVAILVKENPKSYTVRLRNGDIIKRKKKDCIIETKKKEKRIE